MIMMAYSTLFADTNRLSSGLLLLLPFSFSDLKKALQNYETCPHFLQTQIGLARGFFFFFRPEKKAIRNYETSPPNLYGNSLQTLVNELGRSPNGL